MPGTDCNRAQQFVVVIEERNLDLNRLADTGSGKVVGDVCAIRFGSQPFAARGQMVLTLGIVKVR